MFSFQSKHKTRLFFFNSYNNLKIGLLKIFQKASFSRSSQKNIINGIKCTQKPWVVEIIILHRQKWKHLCGGALIHPKWVITAAHSFFHSGKENKPFAPVNAYKVCVGTNKLCNGVKYDVAAIHHPSFEITCDKKIVLNDLALIQLHWQIPYHLAAPIPLAKNCNESYVDRTGYIYGWGATSRNKANINEFSSYLQEGIVTIMDNSQCDDITAQVDDGKICIDCDLSPSIASNGDSGGPLVLKQGKGSPILIGVNSYGDKNFENWDVYTRITSHLDWIYYVTQLNDMQLVVNEYENVTALD